MPNPDMDDAAKEAAEALKSLDPDAVKAVATWVKDNLKAGYKRLGKVLVETLKEQS